MYSGQPVFAQVMDPRPMHTLRRCIERCNGRRRFSRRSPPGYVPLPLPFQADMVKRDTEGVRREVRMLLAVAALRRLQARGFSSEQAAAILQALATRTDLRLRCP